MTIFLTLNSSFLQGINIETLEFTRSLLGENETEIVHGDVSLKSDAKYLINYAKEKLGGLDI